jgi:hypothetical protein
MLIKQSIRVHKPMKRWKNRRDQRKNRITSIKRQKTEQISPKRTQRPGRWSIQTECDKEGKWRQGKIATKQNQQSSARDIPAKSYHHKLSHGTHQKKKQGKYHWGSFVSFQAWTEKTIFAEDRIWRMKVQGEQYKRSVYCEERSEATSPCLVLES